MIWLISEVTSLKDSMGYLEINLRWAWSEAGWTYSRSSSSYSCSVLPISQLHVYFLKESYFFKSDSLFCILSVSWSGSSSLPIPSTQPTFWESSEVLFFEQLFFVLRKIKSEGRRRVVIQSIVIHFLDWKLHYFLHFLLGRLMSILVCWVSWNQLRSTWWEWILCFLVELAA